MTEAPEDFYNNNIEFRHIDKIVSLIPERTIETTGSDIKEKPETMANKDKKLLSLEELPNASSKRDRKADSNRHNIRIPDDAAAFKLGNLPTQNQALANGSVGYFGMTPGNFPYLINFGVVLHGAQTMNGMRFSLN